MLEKGTEEKYPSNTRFTYGTFHINFNGPLTDEQKLLDIIESATEGTARKDLARSLVKAAPRLMDWLSGEGIALIALGQYHTHVLSPVQRTGAGLYWDGYAGDVTLQKLEANLKKRGGVLLRGTKALALKLGNPVAVEAEQAQKKMTFKAGAVVIADGGFQANLAAVAALADRHTLVLADRLIHHSLLAGVRACGARLQRFRHNLAKFVFGGL